MKIFNRIAPLSVIAISLTGCLGSSGGVSSDAIIPAEFAHLGDVLAALDNGELPEASSEQLTGSATMVGAVSIDDVDDANTLNLIGDLSMTMNFNDGTLSGTASGFDLYESATGDAISDGVLTGALNVSGTVVGTGLTGNMNGTLLEEHNIDTLTDNHNHNIEMAMGGTIFNNSGALVASGDMSGTIDGEAQTGGFVVTE